VPIAEVDKIWMDGELVDWADAKIHVLSHALHYGSGVFEGIRAYETARGPAVWHLEEHLQRLLRSAKLYHMDLPYSYDELVRATKDVIRANGLSSCYIRPIAIRGYGEMGVNPLNAPINVSIAV
jgi:branched-chain amino acid aminotransferase